MAPPRRADIRDKDLQGLKYFRLLGPLLEPLHDDGRARDRAGTRQRPPPVFFKDGDYAPFLKLPGQAGEHTGMRLLTYGLIRQYWCR
jgi:hypothetical protein